MSRLNDLTIRLYRRLFGSPSAPFAGEAAALLDGHAAVAVTTAAIADSATFGPDAAPARFVWEQEVQRRGSSLFGTPLDSIDSEGARGALAAAMGQALAGRRGAVFLSGPELAGALDLLHAAAGRHLPLVVQLHNVALPAHGDTRGTGHEALHLAAESGCAVLIAANVQEAVDLTLVAHRLAELALVPVVVAQDAEATARSAQEVALATAELAARFVGAPGDDIPAPTPAQAMLFGERRRRLPRQHDLDQPMLSGARHGADTFALGAAASGLFFEEHLGSLVDAAFAELSALTHRPYGRLFAHRLEGAAQVLLAQGAAVETACTVADAAGRKVGVLGVRCLRPSPAADLATQLAGRKTVAVLERRAQPLAGDPALLRELRAGLERAAENRRYGATTHPGYPALEERKVPRLCSAIYGIGGLPLRAADLSALLERLHAAVPPRLFVGLKLHAHTPDYPKRQVMLDRLRRAYPQVAEQGLYTDAAADLRPAGALSLAVLHPAQGSAAALAGDAGALLQRLGGGRTRTLTGAAGPGSRDRLLHAPAGPGWPGDDFLADSVVVAPGTALAAVPLGDGLAQGALVLVASAQDDEALWAALGPANQTALSAARATLYRLALEDGDPGADPEPAHARLLGGLFGALAAAERLDASRRKLVNAWEEGLPEERREPLRSAFEAGYDAVAPLCAGDVGNRPPRRDDTPTTVRHLGDGGQTWDSLPRFWDQVGALQRDGEGARLSADPFLATGTVPPLSATFRDLSAARSLLPRFDPEACSACGACWSVCPDSAIGVAALPAAALIDAGIRATKGDALRPLAAKLAGRVAALGRQGGFTGGAAGALLRRAWDENQAGAPLPAERLASVEPAVEALIAWAGDLPLALTETLFRTGEKAKKDAGELLALAVNPASCKGCGLCVAVCDDAALTAAPQDEAALAHARRVWAAWSATPDTASGTIERVAAAGAMDAMAALLLSRHCAFALSGGDVAEPGSGEKIALRHALAATEYQQQPLLYRSAAELRELRERLQRQLREALAEVIPSDDLDALAARLQGSGEHLDLAALAGGDAVDSARLQRLVDLIRALDDQHQRLTAGRYGLGRARFGLAVAPGSIADWAGTFPNNPFQVPVTVGEPMVGFGALQAQVAEVVKTVALLERAREMLGDRRQATGANKDGALAWDGLGVEQKRLCSPLFVVGNEAELGGRWLAQVMWLLDSGLPVKVLVTSELDLGLDGREPRTRAALADPRSDLGLMALAQRDAYVAQSSIADGTHLRTTLREALRFPGPALIRVHAPSPARHGFAADATLERARAALRSRALPLFRYHPEGDGVFGARLDLDGNPDPRGDWSRDADGSAFTPLHWAAGEARFAGHFAALAEDAPGPTEALAWLALEPQARARKTPFVALTRNGEVRRYRVGEALLARVETLADAWRTLQELAGLVTPFTERVRQEAEARIAEAHQAEIDALRRTYEARLDEQASGMRNGVAEEIRERLLVLAGYK